MNEQWIKDLQKRLENYEEPAPQGLWEDIGKAMGKQKSRKKVVPMYRRIFSWSAAVGAAAAMAAIAWVISGRVSEPATLGTNKVADCTVAGNHGKDVASTPASGTVLGTRAENTAGWPKHTRSRKYMAESMPAKAVADAAKTPSVALPDENTAAAVSVAGAETADSGKGKRGVVKSAPRKRQHSVAGRSIVSSRDGNGSRRLFSEVTPKRVSRLSVGVSAENLLDKKKKSYGYGMLRSEFQTPSVISPQTKVVGEGSMTEILMANRNEKVYTKKKHRLPVRLGVSVSYHLSDRLSLESGLTYSYLSSDLTSGSNSHRYETDQSLHYLGIPVNVNYSLWKNRYWDIYASAGGVVEKCVKGKSETDYIIENKVVSSERENVRVNPLQFSVNAAAGVQFNILSKFGIYVEPGLAYYIDNGSSVETIYKEKPLNFNLRMGLRLSF